MITLGVTYTQTVLSRIPEKVVQILLNRPQGQFSLLSAMSVCLSVCLSVCVCHRQTPASGLTGDFWSKGVSLILACNDKNLVLFFVSMIFFCVFNFFGFLEPAYWEPAFFGEWGSQQGEGLWMWLLALVTGDTQHVTRPPISSDLALLAWSVIESLRPFVCMCVYVCHKCCNCL